jgi:hypothetical protein
MNGAQESEGTATDAGPKLRGRQRKEESMFFFEKKNQKTFIHFR